MGLHSRIFVMQETRNEHYELSLVFENVEEGRSRNTIHFVMYVKILQELGLRGIVAHHNVRNIATVSSC